MLIVGRAIAGAGAAGCFTGAFCIVAVSLPLQRRPFYIGILQSTFGIATIIGPILGGAFTEHATWRWCFWINLPMGALTILALVFFFKNPPSASSDTKVSIAKRIAGLDILGAGLFIPSVIMILMALEWYIPLSNIFCHTQESTNTSLGAAQNTPGNQPQLSVSSSAAPLSSSSSQAGKSKGATAP